MQYYGNRLSENISRREPEGYLLCLNVPVARTGTQDYLPEELGLASGPGFISVYRPEEEQLRALVVDAMQNALPLEGLTAKVSVDIAGNWLDAH